MKFKNFTSDKIEVFPSVVAMKINFTSQGDSICIGQEQKDFVFITREISVLKSSNDFSQDRWRELKD